MTIVSRPSSVASLLGGSIELPLQACAHEPAREVSPWTGSSMEPPSRLWTDDGRSTMVMRVRTSR